MGHLLASPRTRPSRSPFTEQRHRFAVAVAVPAARPIIPTKESRQFPAIEPLSAREKFGACVRLQRNWLVPKKRKAWHFLAFGERFGIEIPDNIAVREFPHPYINNQSFWIAKDGCVTSPAVVHVTQLVRARLEPKPL